MQCGTRSRTVPKQNKSRPRRQAAAGEVGSGSKSVQVQSAGAECLRMFQNVSFRIFQNFHAGSPLCVVCTCALCAFRCALVRVLSPSAVPGRRYSPVLYSLCIAYSIPMSFFKMCPTVGLLCLCLCLCRLRLRYPRDWLSLPQAPQASAGVGFGGSAVDVDRQLKKQIRHPHRTKQNSTKGTR